MRIKLVSVIMSSEVSFLTMFVAHWDAGVSRSVSQCLVSTRCSITWVLTKDAVHIYYYPTVKDQQSFSVPHDLNWAETSSFWYWAQDRWSSLSLTFSKGILAQRRVGDQILHNLNSLLSAWTLPALQSFTLCFPGFVRLCWSLLRENHSISDESWWCCS